MEVYLAGGAIVRSQLLRPYLLPYVQKAVLPKGVQPSGRMGAGTAGVVASGRLRHLPNRLPWAQAHVLESLLLCKAQFEVSLDSFSSNVVVAAGVSSSNVIKERSGVNGLFT